MAKPSTVRAGWFSGSGIGGQGFGDLIFHFKNGAGFEGFDFGDVPNEFLVRAGYRWSVRVTGRDIRSI